MDMIKKLPETKRDELPDQELRKRNIIKMHTPFKFNKAAWLNVVFDKRTDRYLVACENGKILTSLDGVEWNMA